MEQKNTRAKVDPFHLQRHLSLPTVIEKLENIIANFPRASIVATQDNYIHAEFKTFLGFVDDVEFLIDHANHLLHLRSASRLGYSDLGKNKSRYLKLKKILLKEGLIQPE